MAEASGDANEVNRLQRCITDLVSLLALPAMWTGADPLRIIQTLLDAVIGILNLDLAYVRLRVPIGAAPMEMARVAHSHSSTARVEEICAALHRRVGDVQQSWPARTPNPVGEGELTILALPLGLHSELGTIVAGSKRADFPAQTEKLLLSVAANQAAIGLQEARLLFEQKQAQAELSRGVAYREQLMGILGHDLRNPLWAVLGMTELLQLDASSPKVKENLDIIKLAATRMSEMIETILDYTRIRFSDGELPISRAEMNFGEMCRGVVDEALAAYRGRMISLETFGDLSGQWDAARLGQVVSNLVGNAIAHGDEKRPVELIARADSTAVTLDVVNRGPTIAAEQLATLFEPFVRGAGSDRGQGRGGLGLGLYIAKQIVSAHGGTLTAWSLDGTTKFTVKLPRVS